MQTSDHQRFDYEAMQDRIEALNVKIREGNFLDPVFYAEVQRELSEINSILGIKETA